MRLSHTGIGFAVFLGALAALPPISIDMALPALVSIGTALRTTPSAAGLTLSLFMAGFAVGPIIYGPLADRHGRRPLLLAGLTLFTIGGLAATGAGSILMLLAARFLQGVGAGAGMALAFAIVRDLFEGQAAQRRFAAITMVANVAPVLAPAAGAGLLALAGWRSIYGVTALSGLLLAGIAWLGLDETLASRTPIRESLPSYLVRVFGRVLTHGDSVRHIVVNGLCFGWMFAYVSGSPLILIGVMHVAPTAYALLFACTAGGIIAGAFINGRLARRGIRSGSILVAAILLAIVSSGTLAGISIADRLSLPVAMPLLVLSTLCFGLATPSAVHGALDPMPDLAAVAGGLLTSVQMLGGALASALVAILFPYIGPSAMAGVMTAFAIAAFAVYLSQRASI